MKTIVKIFLFASMFALLLATKGTKASVEFKKIIRKEFAIHPDGQLIIHNRFGQVHCNNWEKNSISFEITIEVVARNQEEANRMFELISVEFADSPSQVSARTAIQDRKRNQKIRFSIDYSVFMPVSINLDLTNKFGDVFIAEVQGKAKINLSYGKLEARKFANSDNLLDINFSKANVNWIKGAVALLKYSEMNLDYAGSLMLDSKFSNLDANTIIALNINFEGGELNLDENSSLEGKTKFSDIDIHRIEQSLDLDIQYGNCDVHEMPPGFSRVAVTNKYGDISIGLDEQAHYHLEADLKFCDLEYPSEKTKFSLRSVTPTEKNYKGVVGGTENPAATVIIRSEFGNVSLY